MNLPPNGTSELEAQLLAAGVKRLMPPQPDQRRDKWVRWISEMANDVFNLSTRRFVWESYRRVLAANRAVPYTHLQLIFDEGYATAQALAVRRLTRAQSQRQSISLPKLLREIADHPELVSRALVLGHAGLVEQQVLGLRYEARFDTTTGYVIPVDVKHEADELERSCAAVVDYVDQWVAHHDLRMPSPSPPDNTVLNGSIERIQAVYSTWRDLLTGVGVDFEPHFMYDWMAPLRHVWMPPEVEALFMPQPRDLDSDRA